MRIGERPVRLPRRMMGPTRPQRPTHPELPVRPAHPPRPTRLIHLLLITLLAINYHPIFPRSCMRRDHISCAFSTCIGVKPDTSLIRLISSLVPNFWMKCWYWEVVFDKICELFWLNFKWPTRYSTYDKARETRIDVFLCHFLSDNWLLVLSYEKWFISSWLLGSHLSLYPISSPLLNFSLRERSILCTDCLVVPVGRVLHRKELSPLPCWPHMINHLSREPIIFILRIWCIEEAMISFPNTLTHPKQSWLELESTE